MINSIESPPIRLDSFLERLFSERDKLHPQPVYIYWYEPDFFPDEEGESTTELMAVYCSDMRPKYLFLPRYCSLEVKEIYWTKKGIVLTVDEPEGEHKEDEQQRNEPVRD